MIKKRNNSYGLNTNVHVDPSASANASPNITNHIYIRDFKKTKAQQEKPYNFSASAVSENNIMTRDIQLEEEQNDTTTTQEHNAATQEQNTELVNETHTTTTPVTKPQKIYAREVIITTETNKQDEQKNVKVKTAEQVILETYARILLDQNKALILNLISKQTIIVPRTDLEEIIKAKTGVTCQVTLVDDEVGCCLAKYSPIKKIETIKLIQDELVSDFKQTRNNDYNDLINLYHLCLKYCIDH